MTAVPEDHADNLWITVAHAALLMGRTHCTVSRWVRQGLVETRTLETGQIRVFYWSVADADAHATRRRRRCLTLVRNP